MLDHVAFDAVEGFDHACLRAFVRLNFDWMVVRAVQNQKVDFVEARVATP